MRILCLLLLLLAHQAMGQVGSTAPTCIWSGTVGDCLPSAGLLLRNQRDLRLGELSSNGSNYIALQSTASLSGDVTYTLPADGANGSLFYTNGSGTLAWLAGGAANTVLRGAGTTSVPTYGQIDDPGYFTTGAAAGASAIGIVTTSAQTLAGAKTFSGGWLTTTTGGTPATCTDYETGSFSASFTGARSISVTVNFTRVCNMVTMSMQRSIGVSCGSAATFVASGAVPSRLRSTFGSIGQMVIFIPVQNSGSTQSTPGAMAITSAGTMEIGLTASFANFSSGSNCGFFETSWSYPIF